MWFDMPDLLLPNQKGRNMKKTYMPGSDSPSVYDAIGSRSLNLHS